MNKTRIFKTLALAALISMAGTNAQAQLTGALNAAEQSILTLSQAAKTATISESAFLSKINSIMGTNFSSAAAAEQGATAAQKQLLISTLASDTNIAYSNVTIKANQIIASRSNTSAQVAQVSESARVAPSVEANVGELDAAGNASSMSATIDAFQAANFAQESRGSMNQTVAASIEAQQQTGIVLVDAESCKSMAQGGGLSPKSAANAQVLVSEGAAGAIDGYQSVMKKFGSGLQKNALAKGKAAACGVAKAADRLMLAAKKVLNIANPQQAVLTLQKIGGSCGIPRDPRLLNEVLSRKEFPSAGRTPPQCAI